MLVLTACFSLTANAQWAYITNSSDSSVSVINVATNTVATTIPVGQYPWGVSVSHDGAKVYITNAGANTVSVINTATNTVSATIPVGLNPNGIVVNSDGSRVYVVNNDDNTVSVINTNTNSVTASISVGNSPAGVSVSPDGSKVYVTNWDDNTVSVINAAADTVLVTITVGLNPVGIDASPNGRNIYVANSNDGTVSVINADADTVSATITTIANNPYGITVSPDGSKIYVTNEGNPHAVNVIDSTTNSVANTITVGTHPLGISITPDGSKLYVANYSDNTVSVINAATNTVINTITVGTNPLAFGNFIAPCAVQSSTITASGTTTFCMGDSVVLTSSSATSYLWNNSSTDSSISVHSSGNYFATVTFINGCTATSDTITVTVHPSYADTAYSQVCQGSSFTFPDSTTIIANVDTTQTSHFTTINSCDSIIFTYLTVNSTIATITPNDTLTFCSGDSMQLTASTGANFLWNNGATTQSIYASDSGNYTVTITGSNGCTGISNTTNVIVNPSPPVPTISVFVLHDTTFLISSVGSGIQWEYDAPFIGWFPIPTDTNFISIGLISGCYEVVATGTNGCTSVSDSVCITVATGIPEITSNNGISVYPNPNNGTFILNCQMTNYNCQLKITDVCGRIVYSQKYNVSKENETLTLPLASGIYIWQMVNEAGLIGNGKLIILNDK